MKVLVMLVALFASNVFAYQENPHQEFDMTRNYSNDVSMTFIQAKNVQAACDKESRKRGYGGFNYAVEACSFWSKLPVGNSCTIITARTANFHTIGHEVRHCLQGDYHK